MIVPLSSGHVRSAIVALAALVCLSVSASAQPHAGDIFLGIDTVRGNGLVTGVIEQDGSATTPVHLFTGVFGDSGFPHFTANPGFDTFVGMFAPGTSIGFDILEPLTRFTGDGFAATDGETLSITFFTLSVTTGDGFVPGFALAIQPNGGFHRHYNMFLDGPSIGVDPAPGIYLLVRRMWSTDPLIPEPSDAFYLLLNNERPASELAAAAEWLEAWLAGEPAPCPADLTGDGSVDGADLGLLLQSWGNTGAADLNADGIIDGADLGLLLSAWGACP